MATSVSATAGMLARIARLKSTFAFRTLACMVRVRNQFWSFLYAYVKEVILGNTAIQILNRVFKVLKN